MADGTVLNPGVGGDTVYDEDDGSGMKLPVSKIILGAHGVNAGPISDTNPLPAKTISDNTGSFSYDLLTVGTSRVQLIVTSTPCTRGVLMKAANGNTGTVYVGDVSVNAPGTPPVGYELGAGEAVLIPIDNANKIYFIADTASQGIFWVAI